MPTADFLDAAQRELRRLKGATEKAVLQVSDEGFFASPGDEVNSIALTMKHMSGNMRSRWRDFFDTDGEKPDRRRDAEFIRENADTRQSIMDGWESGWALAFGTIGDLVPEDLERIVHVRGRSMTVLQAISGQVSHYAYHAGQIVLLAKWSVGSAWQTLSIPRGQSKEYDAQVWRKE